jgi:hypothetical protein
MLPQSSDKAAKVFLKGMGKKKFLKRLREEIVKSAPTAPKLSPTG